MTTKYLVERKNLLGWTDRWIHKGSIKSIPSGCKIVSRVQ